MAMDCALAAALDGAWKPAVEGRTQFPTKWKLLKLHGSTNWLVPAMHVNFQTLEYVSSVPQSERILLYWNSALPYETHKSRWRGGYVATSYCYYPPNIPGRYFEKEEISAKPGHVFVRFMPKGIFAPFDEPDCDGIPASAVLITPVRQKKYDVNQETVNSLWTQSAELLSTSDRVVIVGYSFPPTDIRSLELLGNALATRPGVVAIDVVAPDASAIVSRIGEGRLSNAKSVTAHDMKFEDYLNILARSVPSLMKKAVADYREVGEWATRIYALGQMTLVRPQGDLDLE